jgi:hypothetical protein
MNSKYPEHLTNISKEDWEKWAKIIYKSKKHRFDKKS